MKKDLDHRAVIDDRRLISAIKVLAKRVQQDDAMAYAAALAYNLLFALFPLLLFVSALLGFLHLSPDFHQVFHGPLGELVPVSLLTFLAGAWKELALRRHPTLLSVGVIGFVWGISGAFRQLIDALNHAYEFPRPLVRPMWKTYLLSVVAGLSMGLVAAAAIVLAVVSSSFLRTAIALALGVVVPVLILAVVRWVGLIILFGATLTTIYALMPDRRRRMRWLNPGALVGLAVWALISYGFSTYNDYFNTYNRVYGSLGAIILLMLYLYFVGLAIVVGAEISAMTDTTPL